MPNLKNKTKFNGSSISKNSGWLEKYGDGGLKSVTGPAPKLDAKTIAEGERIASGYNNANKQNAQISQTRNWSQADQEHSDRVKARINNPASDVGILAANMASNLTRFRNLTPEEIARVTDNVGETVNLSSGIATDALTNELVGYGATKAIPFVSKSAKAAGKYLTEETALKNAYKLNPYANKNPLFSNLVKEGEIIKHPFRNEQVPIEKLSNKIDYFHLKADPDNIPYSAAKNTDAWNQLNKDSRFFVKRTDNTLNAVIDNPISYGDDLSDPRKLPIPMNELYKYRSAENLTGKPNWLKGYPKVPKELPSSSNKFKSEIDWSKWNKEIPDNTQLMKEYNTIEQTSKANGTWMKNPDGSKFEGTPEQFVQQNSENFKKAFPEGFDKTYRGVSNFFNTNKLNEPLFTGDISNAKHYASANNPGFWNVNKNIIKEASKFTDPIPQSLEHLNMVREASKTGDWSKVRAIEYNDVLNSNAGGVHSFYSPKSKNSITIDAKSKEWTNIPYEGREMPTDFVAEDLFNKNLDYININNVRDPRIGDLKIINPNRINAKSARGNNGMFDMTNPNIYKAAIPIGLGVAASQNKQDNSQWLDKYK